MQIDEKQKRRAGSEAKLDKSCSGLEGTGDNGHATVKQEVSTMERRGRVPEQGKRCGTTGRGSPVGTKKQKRKRAERE